MPTLTGLDTNPFFTEGDAPALLDSDVTVTDAEQDYDGGTLVVSGLAAGDVVSILTTGVGAGDILFDTGTGMIYFGGTPIGMAVGDDGADLVITWGPTATNAGVEAVIEALTFTNTSDNPDFYRQLTLSLTDAAGNLATNGDALFLQTGAGDQFHGATFSSTAHIAIGDIDNDGDMDAIVSVYGDGFHLLRNNGTASAPNFVDEGMLSIVGTVNNAAGITLVDLNGDGLLDLVVGRYGGTIQQFNQDNAENFVEQVGAANLFDGIQVYASASPGVADLNGDGFLDLIVANGGGRFDYFIGGAGGFTQQTDAANPLDGVQLYGGAGSVSFADIDGDGDLDMVSGSGEDARSVFQNVGDSTTPIYKIWTGSPYRGDFNTGFQSVLVDIDGDGDLDVIDARQNGSIDTYLLGPATPAIDVVVDGIDDPATGVADAAVTASATAATSGNLLAGASDPDTPLLINNAELNGQPIVVGDTTLLPDGTRLNLGLDGQYTLTPGAGARNLGAAGSGASNTSLQYVLTYTLYGGESATATFTIAGVDDNDSLQGTAGDDTINAGVGNDVVYGLAGADVLYGEDGNDTLFGGDGADNLFGGDGADKLYGGDGDDVISGQGGPNSLYGEDGNDSLIGGVANDLLDGGTGNDTLTGGLGNDVYIIDSALDVVIEDTDGGYDIVRSFISIAALADNVEGLQLQGTADLNGTGNALANIIQGNSGNNTLDGGAGVDTISGGDGNDRIIGGLGNDLLRGGAGADTFVVAHAFGTVLETDIVYDFSGFANGGEQDIIDLSAVDANVSQAGDQAFTLVTAFNKHAGQMTLTFDAPSNQTYLKLDTNGDGKADYQMKINGDVTGESGHWLL